MPRIAGFLIPLILLSACASPTPTIEPSPTETPEPLASATPIPLESYRLMPGELVLAASPDDIPAIFATEDLFVDASEGDAEWLDEEPVIGVALNGEARAYPIRLLSLHEVVNDTIGGQPILVTWCPLCYSAIVFDPVVEGTALTFGVSGYLFHSNLVMYDHQSNTLWSQLLAQGLRGAYVGQQLGILAAEHSTWGAWKEAHPDTLVLSARQMDEHEGEIVDPYVGYYGSGATGLGGGSEVDESLPPKSLVVGMRAAGIQRAYPFDAIRELGVINDELGDLPVLLAYNPALNSASAYSRQLGERVLLFEPPDDAGFMRDAGTGSTWDISAGIAIKGELQGAQLTRLNAPIVFWFAWSDIYPETEVFVQ